MIFVDGMVSGSWVVEGCFRSKGVDVDVHICVLVCVRRLEKNVYMRARMCVYVNVCECICASCSLYQCLSVYDTLQGCVCACVNVEVYYDMCVFI